MDLLDLVIVLLVVASVASGWRRGMGWVGLSLAGLLLGVFVGAAVAAPLARHFGNHSASTEALLGSGVFLACVALVQGVGTALGYRVRVATLRTRVARLDSALGAGLAAVGVLAVAWYLGLSLASSSSRGLAAQINRSAVLRGLDALFPRPPGFLNSLSQVLGNRDLPNPFAGLGEPNLAPVDNVPGGPTPGISRAIAATAKVYSQGCGLEAGSSWPLGNDRYATNAHVVAGGQSISVQLPDGRRLDATVVLFDPGNDVAVLAVPGANVAALPTGPDPKRGDTGAVVGYPGGGREQAVAAAVRGTEDARGRDIYGESYVTRRIEVLQAQVIPGNSGGPVVDRGGNVVGMVFAASTTEDGVGYALAMSTIAADLAAGRAAGTPVSTQGCTN